MYTLVLTALKLLVILKGGYTEITKRSPMDIVNNTQRIPLIFFADYFMTLSVSRLYSTELQDD
jgi:hypothetical protein